MEDIVTRKKEEGKEGEVRGGKNSEEEKKGGFINHLISNLPTSLAIPLSPRSRQVNEEQEVTSDSTNQVKEVESTNDDDDDGGSGGGCGGGIINSLISNFFHPSEGEGEQEEKNKEDEKVEADATESKEESSGGLIDNFVSHLPSSLPVPDDAVPTADEAAILIHSIIHD